MSADTKFVLVAIIFALWGLLCVLVYLPQVRDVIRSFDFFGLIPEWRFFAPNPGRHDFHLLFRDEYADGTRCGWVEIAPAQRRPLLAMLVHPERRHSKALLDCMQDFAKRVNAQDPVIEISLPYLSLLSRASDKARLPRPTRVQFLVMYSAGEQLVKDPEVLYVSKFHRV